MSSSRKALAGRERARGPGGRGLHRALPSLFKPSSLDLVLFSRQLAVFQRAGVALVPAVEALAEQTTSATLRDVLYEARDDLVTGYPLSAALAKRLDVFGRMYVDIVRAGEATGRLDAVLGQLADEIERAAAARRRLRAALLYPALVILTAFGMVVVMTVFVLPAMAGLFSEFGADLPLPTRIVLAGGAFARDWGLATFGALAAVAALAFLFSRTPPGGRFFDRVGLGLPVIGTIVRYAAVERTTRTLATLIGAGVPLAAALELAKDAAGNSVYRDHLVRVRQRMVAGEGFGEPFAETGLYPPFVKQMVRVGERAGALAQFLDDAARYFSEELQLRIETALDLLEPMLTIAVAAVVALVALAVIMPIYTLIGQIR